MKVGLLTIGQSPRPDIASDLPETLSFLEIVEAGALDDLSAEQIESLKPMESETVYVSMLRNGSEVLVAKERLAPLLQEKVRFLRHNDAKVIVLLCSGEFKLGNEGLIILPSRILRSAVGCVLDGKGKLGILVPGEKQIQDAVHSWSEFAQETRVFSFSPYADSIDSLKAASKAMSDRDLIVMDCMGYSTHHKRIVRQISGKPVIAARTATFRYLEELVT